MRHSAVRHILCRRAHVILHPPNCQLIPIHHQIRRPRIPVIRLADAPCIRHNQALQFPHIRDMHMRMNHNPRPKPAIDSPQLLLTSTRPGTPPQIPRTRMHQPKSFLNKFLRQRRKPTQSLLTQLRHSPRNRVAHHPKHSGQRRQRRRKLRQLFRIPQHFIGVPTNSRPTQRTNVIHNFRRMRSARRQIPAMHNTIRRHLTQIRQHRLKRPPIPVNIRHNRDSHHYASRTRTHPHRVTTNDVIHRKFI
jgi:hypothetical protein